MRFSLGSALRPRCRLASALDITTFRSPFPSGLEQPPHLFTEYVLRSPWPAMDAWLDATI